MPAPTNIDAASATDITSLPHTLNQNVHDAGVTYTVWYKYTPDFTGVLGVWGFGDLASYTPQTSIFDNLGVDIYKGIFNYSWRPIQIPVTSGHTIWFRFATNSGTVSPAVLTGLIQKFAVQTAPIGSLFINDASSSAYLATLLNGATGEPLDYIHDFPGGEHMAALEDGTMLCEDTDNSQLQIRSAQFAQVTDVPISFVRISSNRTDLFYVSSSGGLVRTVDPAGNIGGTSWNVGSLSTLAPSRDDLILYFADGTSGAVVQRWDLIGNIALSNLVAGVANYVIKDMMVLGDGTVLVCYLETSGSPRDLFVRHYSAAGATLHTYSTPFDASTGVDPHLAHAIDDPTSFWSWYKKSNAQSRFVNVDVAAGTVVNQGDWLHFSSGLSDEPATATPSEYFGHSESCTFIVTVEEYSTIITPNPVEGVSVAPPVCPSTFLTDPPEKALRDRFRG